MAKIATHDFKEADPISTTVGRSFDLMSALPTSGRSLVGTLGANVAGQCQSATASLLDAAGTRGYPSGSDPPHRLRGIGIIGRSVAVELSGRPARPTLHSRECRSVELVSLLGSSPPSTGCRVHGTHAWLPRARIVTDQRSGSAGNIAMGMVGLFCTVGSYLTAPSRQRCVLGEHA